MGTEELLFLILSPRLLANVRVQVVVPPAVPATAQQMVDRTAVSNEVRAPLATLLPDPAGEM